MIRTLYILGVFTFLGAGAVLTACVVRWSAEDSETQKLRSYPSAVVQFRENMRRNLDPSREMVTPLIVQARALASHMNRVPQVMNARSLASQIVATSDPTPDVRPRASSVAFKLHGTSVYRDRPERSMALISEPGGSEGERKWVREGAALGHFVVQEIRRGVVVLSDGDGVREMTVEPSPGRRSLVRSYTASVARADAGGPPERLEADSNAVAEPATR